MIPEERQIARWHGVFSGPERKADSRLPAGSTVIRMRSKFIYRLSCLAGMKTGYGGYYWLIGNALSSVEWRLKCR